MTELPDPSRIVRLGPVRLRAFAAQRDVRMTRPLAERIAEAARQALPVPGAAVARRLLDADLSLLADVEAQIDEADTEIEVLLPATPFAVLRSMPGWAPRREAAYGAAVGDPERWLSPRLLYRAAGLTPRLFGVVLWHQEPSARAYGAALRARGKPGAVIAIAMAHRADRIAFAMVRDQQPWNGGRWAA